MKASRGEGPVHVQVHRKDLLGVPNTRIGLARKTREFVDSRRRSRVSLSFTASTEATGS